MGVIVDSSVLIAAERQRLDLASLLASHPQEVFQIAAITAAELLHGCERAIDPVIRERRTRFVESVFDQLIPAPFGLLEARAHARLWAFLEQRGEIIGPRDLEIAATALAVGFSLATLNAREFQRVPALRLIDLSPYVSESGK